MSVYTALTTDPTLSSFAAAVQVGVQACVLLILGLQQQPCYLWGAAVCCMCRMVCLLVWLDVPHRLLV